LRIVAGLAGRRLAIGCRLCSLAQAGNLLLKLGDLRLQILSGRFRGEVILRKHEIGLGCERVFRFFARDVSQIVAEEGHADEQPGRETNHRGDDFQDGQPAGGSKFGAMLCSRHGASSTERKCSEAFVDRNEENPQRGWPRTSAVSEGALR